MPIGFNRSYEDLGGEYEELCRSYESQLNVHNVDPFHCNVWHVPPLSSRHRMHKCQKPVKILERLVKVSSNNGATVLDCFMGSGSTGVACANTGRKFIGIEQDKYYFDMARERINAVRR